MNVVEYLATGLVIGDASIMRMTRVRLRMTRVSGESLPGGGVPSTVVRTTTRRSVPGVGRSHLGPCVVSPMVSPRVRNVVSLRVIRVTLRVMRVTLQVIVPG